MEPSDILTLFDPLFDDIRENEQFYKSKPLLAHYTSMEVLENILRNDEIWFSNPLFMNDLDEVRFGIQQSMPLVINSEEIEQGLGSSTRFKSFREFYEQSVLYFMNNQALDTYVFCLSEHDEAEHNDGLLSMWRGYGGNGKGAAIVFDTSKIEPTQGSPLIVSKVVYGSTDKRISWINKVMSTYAKIISENTLSDDQIQFAAIALFRRILFFALFTKHVGFHEEREWRIVYMKDGKSNIFLDEMLHYRIGSQGIEPKLRFKVWYIPGVTSENMSIDKIIHSIILGPTVSSPIANAMMLRMLDRLGKGALKDRVRGSTIPFRVT